MKPLFLTGVARSGSNLLGRMLDAHPRITVAIDPYLVLFKWFRSAALDGGVAPAAPLSDYYFDDKAVEQMRKIQASPLTIPFPPTGWELFLAGARSRAEQECRDLAGRLEELRAPTFREMFERGLQLIAAVRGMQDWVGIKEVWVVEFYGPLARAFPDARFLILHRDPRAILASLLALARKDPTQAAHPLSYARHWRKTIAFALRFGRAGTFADRLHTVRYEDLVQRPEPTARNLCEFLAVPFDPRILDTDRFLDPLTGQPWTGNSSFDASSHGLVAPRADRWRSTLDPRALRMVELVCAPEMRAVGYEPVTAAEPDDDVRRYLTETNSGGYSWRSDTGDPELEFAREVERYRLLRQPSPDPASVHRAFLFEEAFERVRP